MLLETNLFFTYEKTVRYKDTIDFEVYNDDYGQSYVLAWVDPITNKVQEWGCGTFNGNYMDEIEEIGEFVLKKIENNGKENK